MIRAISIKQTAPIVDLDKVQAGKHLQFWHDPARYELLRGGFKLLCNKQWTPRWFEEAGKMVVGKYMPHFKALDRFRRDRKSIFNEPEKLTGLLVTCGYLFENNANIRNDPLLKPLMALAGDVSREMDIGSATEAVLGQSKAYSGGKSYPRDKLALMHDAIQVPAGHDPKNPEFPPFSPRFPATPTYNVTIDGRMIAIKDESFNPTGSHKDRMAWELVIRYKELARVVLQENDRRPLRLPHFSIISSGSAALAIQAQFQQRGLPRLKVLMDQKRTDRHVVQLLQSLDAEVVLWDLDSEELNEARVLELTRNQGGADVTTRDIDRPLEWRYYDWLAYEVLREQPKHIFCPFGTGDLLCNIVKIIAEEAATNVNDQRLEKGKQSVENISIYGAAPKYAGSTMDKLYARFNPTRKPAQALMQNLVERKVIGRASGIHGIDDRIVALTLELARSRGINTEPSGIAGLALCRELMKDIPKKEKILVINTGWLHLPKYGM